MTKRTIALIAALGALACDGGGDPDAGFDAGMEPEVDAGMDAGMDEPDGGMDAGMDAGPPQPVNFGIRLANMVAGLTPNPDMVMPSPDDRGGAVHICLDTAFEPARHLTMTRTLPYGGVSPYFPFLHGAGAITYTVSFYDAATFTACAEDTPDPTDDILTITIDSTAVLVGEFHTGLLTGWTSGGCMTAGIPTAACPPIELDIHQDDHTPPAAGMVGIRVANGVTQPPVPGMVDVCAEAAPPAIALGTGVPVRGISAPTEIAPLAGPAAITVRAPDVGGTPCAGAHVPAPPPDGAAGSVPTNATLVAAGMGSIPSTYDANATIWIFVFPVGGGSGALAGRAPLAIPWMDTPNPDILLP